MSNTPVFLCKKDEENFELDIPDIPDWAGFEKIANFLEKKYDAVVIERRDGPESRSWELAIDNNRFTLNHDDFFGNEIVGKGDRCYEILSTIERDLLERLRES